MFVPPFAGSVLILRSIPLTFPGSTVVSGTSVFGLISKATMPTWSRCLSRNSTAPRAAACACAIFGTPPTSLIIDPERSRISSTATFLRCSLPGTRLFTGSTSCSGDL